MLSKHLTMALLGSALICAPAMAQTSGTGTTGTGTTGAPATTAPATGSSSTMGAGSSASGSSMTQMQPGQWRASQIEGLDVYNNNNEKIGDISEMLVDSSGKIQAVVIGVGGFLGIGERDVAIAFDQVKFVNEPRANATATNTTTGAPATGGVATNTTTGTMNATPNTTGSTATGTTAAGNTAAGSTAANTAARMAPDHAMVNMTKDQLQGMPEFRYNR
jgi:sporulation protein YlmC with PRC-barrel domain